jgi:hypothetical protein
MDNYVYGLTKNQTSPTSPVGRKSKTDPQGSFDRPINPMKQLLATGASFVARTHATQVSHMNQMFERAILHDGFSVVECLSECTMFYPGAFDDAVPRKGGVFDTIDETQHDTSSDIAAWQLADLPAPGKYGVFFQTDRGRPKTPWNATSSPKPRPNSAAPARRTCSASASRRCGKPDRMPKAWEELAPFYEVHSPHFGGLSFADIQSRMVIDFAELPKLELEYTNDDVPEIIRTASGVQSNWAGAEPHQLVNQEIRK